MAHGSSDKNVIIWCSESPTENGCENEGTIDTEDTMKR